MPSQTASIQSYFPQSSPINSSPASKPSATNSSSTSRASDNTFVAGDGFTKDEMTANTPDTVPTGPFTPLHGVPYNEVKLSDLAPTESCITFTGRIVNIYAPPPASLLQKKPRKAEGCLRCMVSDGTGLVTVRLWHTHLTYPLRLGSLITVWTTYVSLSDNSYYGFSSSAVTLYTSIFPEHERRCHVQVHEDLPENNTKCRMPLGYGDGDTTQMPGLMTLAAFTSGGHDALDAKVLVCVKSIGARKKTTRKNSTTPTESTTIHLFDHTATASLTLWNAASTSPLHWSPHHTIILLTRPSCHLSSTPWLSLTAATTVHIDPPTRDARWLRAYARRLLARPPCNPALPVLPTAADTDAADERVLYRLADLDTCARTTAAGGGTKPITGYLSVLLTGIHLTSLHRRAALACADCTCGFSLYANAVSAKCPRCAKEVALRLNPRIVGAVVDETGGVGVGAMVWAEEAWGELLGREAEEVVSAGVEVLRGVEERLAWVRVALVAGWVGDGEEGGGRVCVMGVRA